MGQGEVFRRNHLLRLVESINTKQSIVTFLNDDRILLVEKIKEHFCQTLKIFFSELNFF